MNKILFFSIMIFLTFAISGCSMPAVGQLPDSEKVVISNGKKTDFYDQGSIKDKIYLQYEQWKGTNYKLGGLSKGGIDCSGFVYVTFLEKMNIKIPRSTNLQSMIGKEVGINELLPGDLVFFKTGVRIRHVGIYIENGNFVHASTNNGVMISNLGDYYWKDKYWQSRRVDY